MGGLLKFWDYQLAPFYKSVYRRTLRVFVLFRFVFRGGETQEVVMISFLP